MLMRLMNGETAVSDDADLIDQALDGRSEAFGQLVLKYQDRLYNTVFHVIGHAEDARDVTQEALVQAFVKLQTFRRDSAFYTWLYRIAMNAAMSRARRRRKMASLDASTADPPDDADQPAETMERKERCRQIQRAIAELPDDYRAAIVLREIDGHSYEAIAEILNLPLNTVRTRLHRARLQLRESLDAMFTNK
jgi:RNA polymerase sigma-70 factor, ECF subfamily